MIGPKGFEKKLAIKRILPEYSHDDEFVQMFVDEARISSHLHHTNIIPIFDFGQVDHQFYIAMELIEGANLKNLFFRALKRDRPFSRPMVFYIISRLASALDYAHQVKVEGEEHYLQLVHRDVSPQNVLISRRGEIKITDFGIAKAAIRLTQTQPGKIQGKYSYMSPEQALGRSIDHRSDIFSLGIIFFELLTGKKVYGSSDSIDRYKQATKAEIPRLNKIVPDIPNEIDALVMQMLAKDPKARPNSCSEVVSVISTFIAKYREDELMKELGEITSDLFPATSQDKKSEKSVTKPSKTSNVSQTGGQELDGKSFPPYAKTVKDFSFKVFFLRYKVKLIIALSLLTIGSIVTVVKILPSQPTHAGKKPRPKVEKPIPTDPQSSALLDKHALELQLIDIENEIEAIENQIETTTKTSSKKIPNRNTSTNIAAKPKTQCPSGMQWIPGGMMSVGSSLEDTSRQELLERPFAKQNIKGFCIDIYEYPNQKGQPPLVNISYQQAQSYCTAQNKKLCTDVQWERACKGPDSTQVNLQFPYGQNSQLHVCNVHKHSLENDHPITQPSSGSFSACKSTEGVYDLSGSVAEWTLSSGILDTESKITKGGSYMSSAYASRCSSINEVKPSSRATDIGLRCCK
ncbi:MAG: bifunctional serine/threonine-protein kinase/formylglycine-generating enzyme family protein [Bdellovibrionota bacterium]